MKAANLINKLNKINVKSNVVNVNGYNMDVEFTINGMFFKAGYLINDDTIFYNHNFRRRSNHENVEVNGERKAYATDVRVDVRKSETNNIYIKIRKKSEGRSKKTANSNANQIEYSYQINNNEIVLNGYFLSNYENTYKDEYINVTVFIPIGKTIYSCII